ncbi:MAG: hypothetical protein ACRD88_11130, partial [Terriglobia bacterium]
MKRPRRGGLVPGTGRAPRLPLASVVRCLLALLLPAVLLFPPPAAAQSGTTGGEWRAYGGDRGSTKYSPLDQINRDNVSRLQIAWRRPAVDPQIMARNPELRIPGNFRVTPLMVDGVLYSPNGVGLVEAFHP